jgi:DNA/RNA-binding domain of Phe-tRNA-synthetase-like protein
MIRIDDTIIGMFPDVKLGVVVAEGMGNPSVDTLARLRDAQRHVRATLTPGAIASHPKIADWRAAYAKFGAKPSEYRSSVEALARRVLNGKELPDINALVNLYNAVSLCTLLPAGGDDLDSVEGEITLTVAAGDEPFAPLGGGEERVPAGEVIYMDEAGVLCRRWNWRECDRTKMTDATRRVMLVLEGLSSTTHQEMRDAVALLASELHACFGVGARSALLDAQNRSF